MSNYAEDYRNSTDTEKLDILNNIWNNFENTEEEKAWILKETQKIYNRMKGRE